jgi:RNA polymerase sigma factor (sigma-70 family)
MTSMRSGSGTGEIPDQHQAFEALYATWPSLEKWASRIAPPGVDACEIFADAVGDVWMKRREGEKIERLVPYVMTTMINRCRNARRHSRVRERVTPLIEVPVHDRSADALSQVIDRDRSARVRASVRELGELERLAITLLYLRGMSRDEVAFVLDVQPDTVTGICARAKRTLRAVLGTPRCA